MGFFNTQVTVKEKKKNSSRSRRRFKSVAKSVGSGVTHGSVQVLQSHPPPRAPVGEITPEKRFTASHRARPGGGGQQAEEGQSPDSLGVPRHGDRLDIQGEGGRGAKDGSPVSGLGIRANRGAVFAERELGRQRAGQ